MSPFTSTQRRATLVNATLLAYTLLACFPVVWEGERAAVRLVLEYILTFNIEIGRIVLTREGYELAQGLMPQLLVLASRRGFVYTGGDKPSFMDVAAILQTIVEPLAINLDTLAWADVYLTKDDARALLSLPLDRLQTMVDEWVCEQSELDIPKVVPDGCVSTSCALKLTARKHGDAWWMTHRDGTGETPSIPRTAASEIPPPTPPDHSFVDVGGCPASQPIEPPLVHQQITPLSGNQPSAHITQNDAAAELDKRGKDVAWWTMSHHISPWAMTTRVEPIPTYGYYSAGPASLDLSGVPSSQLAQATTPAAKTPPVATPGIPSPSSTHRRLSKTLNLDKSGDVWWKSPGIVRPLPVSHNSQAAIHPGQLDPIVNPISRVDPPISQGQLRSESPEHLLPGLIRANARQPDGLRHPQPVRALGLSRLIISGITANAAIEARPAQSTGHTLRPPELRLDQAIRTRVDQPNPSPTASLYPPSAYRPWIDNSSTRSSCRDFSTSDLSLGSRSPWTRQLSGSASSFGPRTPTDLESLEWRDDHYVGDMCWAPEFDEESPAHDLRSRAEIEVRKAKEATTGRKLRRKLKSALVKVWKAYD